MNAFEEQLKAKYSNLASKQGKVNSRWLYRRDKHQRTRGEARHPKIRFTEVRPQDAFAKDFHEGKVV